MEIGSEYWLNTIEDFTNDSTPKWLEKYGNLQLTSSGRGALTLILSQLDVKEKTAYLPAYICESVLRVFINLGYKCYFYGITKEMIPDMKRFVNRNVGVFLHMGYYGYGTNSILNNLLNDYKNKSTVIIEDVTHTLFSNLPQNANNTYYFGSLRKWLGLPSGGFAGSKNSQLFCELLESKDSFKETRKKALLLKGMYMKGDTSISKEAYLQLFRQAEAIIDIDYAAYYIDDISMGILNSLNSRNLLSTRRRNYQVLLEGLRDVNQIEAVLPYLPRDVCPFFFPAYTKRLRENLLNELKKVNIFCPIHWPKSSILDERLDAETNDIYDSIFSIPCDQRYGENDMIEIISALKTIMNKKD